MYQKITESMFIEQMNTLRPNQISYDGLQSLFEYYESTEYLGSHVYFDPIAIFCEWTEYETLEEALEQYQDIGDYVDDDGSWDGEAMRTYFQDNTILIEVDSDTSTSVLIHEF